MGAIIISIAIVILIYLFLRPKKKKIITYLPRQKNLVTKQKTTFSSNPTNYKKDYEPAPSSYPVKKSKRSSSDYGYLIKLLNGDESGADRLLVNAKLKYPDKNEQWHIEKAINDILRDRH
jgi:hypothetical protein